MLCRDLAPASAVSARPPVFCRLLSFIEQLTMFDQVIAWRAPSLDCPVVRVVKTGERIRTTMKIETASLVNIPCCSHSEDVFLAARKPIDRTLCQEQQK